ncbi:MAG: pseudouridine synthase [Flammeovirgaceae bacterium]
MYQYFIIYKPFNVLCQFEDIEGRQTLKSLYDFPKDVYSVGRLDMDSEGLLLLTNDKSLNNKLLNPSFQHQREYWVQVEGIITDEALLKLSKGVTINIDGKTYHTLPAKAQKLPDNIKVRERTPPIRFRKSVPDSWLSLKLVEGKNRQVRKMTASVGFPTLRLIRVAIEQLTLGEMKIGEVKELSKEVVYEKLRINR